MPSTKTDLVLSIIVLILALLFLFVWVPMDIESGIFETVRGRTEIGDAFAPVMAGVLLLLGAVLLYVEARRSPGLTRFELSSFYYIIALIAGYAIVTIITRYSGPLAVTLFGTEDETYRNLRDTAPWKYIGFSLGGFVLVFGLISVIERKPTLLSALIAVGAVSALIAIYDLPFDSLLLPPNGDL